MQYRSTLIAVAALSLLGAACGSSSGAAGSSGGGDAAARTAYVAAVMAQPDKNSGFTEPERQCISEAVVDSIGVKVLQAAGITPEAVTSNTDNNSPIPNFKITDAQADGIVTGMFKCADMGAFLLKSFSGSSATPLPADKATCLSKGFAASPEVHDVFKVQLTGGDATAAQTALQNAVLPMATSCNITSTELAGAFGG